METRSQSCDSKKLSGLQGIVRKGCPALAVQHRAAKNENQHILYVGELNARTFIGRWSFAGLENLGRADGDEPAGARDLRRTLNLGGKYFGKSAPELAERSCAFWWFIAGYFRVSHTAIDLQSFLLLRPRRSIEPFAYFFVKGRPFYEKGAYCMCSAEAIARGGGACEVRSLEWSAYAQIVTSVHQVPCPLRPWALPC
jgi:hypothetical protein